MSEKRERSGRYQISGEQRDFIIGSPFSHIYLSKLGMSIKDIKKDTPKIKEDKIKAETYNVQKADKIMKEEIKIIIVKAFLTSFSAIFFLLIIFAVLMSSNVFNQ